MVAAVRGISWRNDVQQPSQGGDANGKAGAELYGSTSAAVGQIVQLYGLQFTVTDVKSGPGISGSRKLPTKPFDANHGDQIISWTVGAHRPNIRSGPAGFGCATAHGRDQAGVGKPSPRGCKIRR